MSVSHLAGRGRLRLLSLAVSLVFAGAIADAGAQTLTAPGLVAPGSIVYDAEGVPVVRGATENDVAFLQGYAHAQNRFFQMDFTRRGASGTVAELVGRAALANDVQIRTLGLRRAAQATWFAMSDTTRGWLKAYADGVNFWLSTNPLPPEYGALELTKAAPWSPVDSVVIGKALAFQLSFDLDIDQTLQFGAYNAAGAVGSFSGPALFFEDIFRVQPPDDRVSIPGFAPTPSSEGGGIKSAKGNDSIDATTLDLARAYREKIAQHPLIGPALRVREDRGASNWWVVGGSRTVSGKPILSNDPHLSLDTPATFIENHLIAADGSLNVVGSSAPGTPGVLLGCNARVCWGLTTNPLDVTDTYQEQFVVNTYGLPTHTLYKGNAEPVQLVLQSYFINQLDGAADNVVRDNTTGFTNGGVTVLVPRRNNGPVVQIAGSTGLSVQYAGWGPTYELECFRQVNRATNLTQFREALTYFDVGSQNFSYADVDGNIAYFTTAEAPIRDDLQNLQAPDGSVVPFLIRDGTGARRHEWLAATNRHPNQSLPFEVLGPNEMPFVVNPASGYIANANNDPVGTTLDNNAINQLRPGGGLYYLNFGYSAYRIGRIDRELNRLFATGKVDVNAMKALQANNQAMDAELVAPFLVQAGDNAFVDGAWAPLRALIDDPQVDDAYKRIAEWNYSTPTGIREGYDPGDNPSALPEPSQQQIDASVATTLFVTWRGFLIRNTIDATLSRVGLSSALPDAEIGYTAVKNMLVNFPTRRGVGASGLNFFSVTGAPSPEAARDFLILKSMRDALDMLASPAFAPAFNGSTQLSDYRWGRLHRIVFDHPLGNPFSIPDTNATYGFANLSAQLPGLARPGGYEIVDASGHNLRANSVNGFMFGSGPARRFIGEMSNPVVAQQILPGGQSGVYGNPLYASQLSRWLTNNYKPLVIDANAAVANPARTLNFVPRQ
jgi:penicillin G amidase